MAEPLRRRRRTHPGIGLALALACALPPAAPAAEPAAQALDGRVQALAETLRCVVCQNQSLAESHAPLAQDLKAQIRSQLAQGRDEDQVRAYLVQRYGDFVLYRPPLRAGTGLLWFGPGLMLLGGLLLLGQRLRRQQALPDTADDDTDDDADAARADAAPALRRAASP